MLVLVREDLMRCNDEIKNFAQNSIMSKAYKLDHQLITTLFEDVEASKVSIKDFDLLELCKRKEYLYGEPATKKRRAIPKLFSEAKRKTDQHYLNFLGKHNIRPGEALKARLLAPPEIKKETPVEIKKEKSDLEDTESEDAKSDDAKSEDAESEDEYASSSDTTITSSASTSRSTESPQKQRSTSPKTPVRDIQYKKQTKRMQSDSESFPVTDSSFSSTASSNILQTVTMLEIPEYKQCGTKEQPYIIIADPERPESCWGFEVALIPNIKVGNYVRSVYHIRHVTTQGMEDEWSSTIPHEEFPTLSNRSVLIRGPSQELWHRRNDIYHEEQFCAQTALIHETQQTAIRQSIVRMYSYWLLVLPKGTVLENYIISHDSINVTTCTQEMTKAFEAEDESGKTQLETLYGMDVYWRIAVAGGSMVSGPGSSTKKRRMKKAATKV